MKFITLLILSLNLINLGYAKAIIKRDIKITEIDIAFSTIPLNVEELNIVSDCKAKDDLFKPLPPKLGALKEL